MTSFVFVFSLSYGFLFCRRNFAVDENKDDKKLPCHTAAHFARGPGQWPTSPMPKAGSDYKCSSR